MKPKHSIQLSIPSPCSQDWDEMTPDAKGRLYGFRFYFFRRLHRPIWLPLSIMIVFALCLPATYAQSPVSLTGQKMLPHKNDSTGPYNLLVKGIILDELKQPAVSAIVGLEQNGRPIGAAVTDIDGNFEIDFHKIADTGNILMNIVHEYYIPVKIPLEEFKKTPTIILTRSPFHEEGLVAMHIKDNIPPDSAIIKGTVLGYKKRPVSGALIYARLDDEYLNYTYSDSSGHFVLALRHKLYSSDTVTAFCSGENYADDVQKWNISNTREISFNLHVYHGVMIQGPAGLAHLNIGAGKPHPGNPPWHLPELTPDQIKRLTSNPRH